MNAVYGAYGHYGKIDAAKKCESFDAKAQRIYGRKVTKSRNAQLEKALAERDRWCNTAQQLDEAALAEFSDEDMFVEPPPPIIQEEFIPSSTTSSWVLPVTLAGGGLLLLGGLLILTKPKTPKRR